MLPIAIQLYSIRKEVEADFRGTMEKIKEMGYEGVEPAGFGKLSVAEAKEILDEVGLKLVSAHFSRVDLKNMELLKEYKEAGLQYAVLASLRDRTPEEGVVMIREMAENCKELGMKLMYHNHDFEFELTKEGGYILDKYYDEIPADLLLPEIDTCWVSVAGVDPIEYIKKYSGRQEVVHLKDYVGSKSANMYGLIGENDGDKKADASKFELRPVGYGKQDVAGIIKASEEAGAKWIVVEQDDPSMGKSPMECAQMSIEYIKSLNLE